MQALTCSYIRIFVITNRIGGKDYFYSSIPITPHHSLSLHITLGVKYFFIDINQLANYLVAQLRFISFKPFGMIRMSKCPRCQKPLVILEYQGIEIDHCFSCSGTWLDNGELERIAELPGNVPADIAASFGPRDRRGQMSDRRCPRCNKRLVTFSAGENVKIELDRCSRGHGFWFDRDEMEAIIKSLHKEGERKQIFSFFADLYKHKFQSGGKGE